MPDLSSRDAVAEVVAKLSAEPDETESAPEGGATDTPEPSETQAPVQDPERVRDGLGRFSKPGKGKPAAKAAPVAIDADDAEPAPAVAAAAAAPAAPVLPEIKAPQELKAAVKEKWASFPREVQEALSESYLHKQKVLSETSQSRKAADEWQQTVAPFAHVLNGAPPHQVVGSLLRTFGTLQTGHQQARDQVVAALIRDYVGTDEASLTRLGALLQAGGSAPAPRAQPQSLTESDLEGWYARRQQNDQRDRAVRAWQEFEGSQPEFLNSGDGPAVRRAMVALVSNWSADNAGQQPSGDVFKSLYEEACRAVPAVRAVIDQRAAAAAAKKNGNVPPAAAAVGLKNEPAGPSGGATGPAKDTREQVRREMARLSGRARV